MTAMTFLPPFLPSAGHGHRAGMAGGRISENLDHVLSIPADPFVA
jgi:hypothetical protein